MKDFTNYCHLDLLFPLLQRSPVDPSKPNFSPHNFSPFLLRLLDLLKTSVSHYFTHSLFPPRSERQHHWLFWLFWTSSNHRCCRCWLKHYVHGFTHKWLQCSWMMLPTCNNKSASSQPMWRSSRSPCVVESVALFGRRQSIKETQGWRDIHTTQPNFSLPTSDILKLLSCFLFISGHEFWISFMKC